MVLSAVVNDRKWSVPPPLNKLIQRGCVLCANDAFGVMIQNMIKQHNTGISCDKRHVHRFLSECSFSLSTSAGSVEFNSKDSNKECKYEK